MSGAVTQLEPYRRRRSVRRTAALLVALYGAGSFVLALWGARDSFEDAIRRAADLLPDELDEAAR
jgi:hypothetical protein